MAQVLPNGPFALCSLRLGKSANWVYFSLNLIEEEELV